MTAERTKTINQLTCAKVWGAIRASLPQPPSPTQLGVIVATGSARGFSNALAKPADVTKTYRFVARL
jgi:hypothetical protein